MEARNESDFLRIRASIADENRGKRKRRYFSQEIKSEVVELLLRGESPTNLSRELGISEATIRGWRTQFNKNTAKPKRLTIVSDFSDGSLNTEPPCTFGKFDAQLPNGILLKNLLLNAQTLHLLRGY